MLTNLRPWPLLMLVTFALGCQPPAPAPPKPQDKNAGKGDPARARTLAEAPAKKPQPDKAGAAEEPGSDSQESPVKASTASEKHAAPDKADPAEPDGQPEEPAAKPDETQAAGTKVLLGTPELTAGIPGDGALSLKDIEGWLADTTNHETLQVELPLGLSAGIGQIKGLKQNPLTKAKIELGRQLYFDFRLSADEKVSCASCHDPEQGYASHTRFGVGIRGLLGGRNSPVSYNRILSDKQFWDGRADSLEDQAIGPIANAIEMGNTHDACVECLKGVKGYRVEFEKIFGKLDIQTVGMALASFERAIVTGPAPFDY